MTTPHEAAERLADSFDVDVDEDATGGRPSQATQIGDMALQAVSLWHSDEGDPFATMEVNGHRENCPLRSREFRNYLDFSFYRAHKKNRTLRRVRLPSIRFRVWPSSKASNIRYIPASPRKAATFTSIWVMPAGRP